MNFSLVHNYLQWLYHTTEVEILHPFQNQNSTIYSINHFNSLLMLKGNCTSNQTYYAFALSQNYQHRYEKICILKQIVQEGQKRHWNFIGPNDF